MHSVRTAFGVIIGLLLVCGCESKAPPTAQQALTDSVNVQTYRLIEAGRLAEADSLLRWYFAQAPLGTPPGAPPDSDKVARLRARQALLYYRAERYREARLLYEEAARLWDAISDTLLLVQLHRAMATVYLWSDTTRVDSLAIRALDNAERLARLVPDDSALEGITRSRLNIYRWRLREGLSEPLPRLYVDSSGIEPPNPPPMRWRAWWAGLVVYLLWIIYRLRTWAHATAHPSHRLYPAED